MDFKLLLSYFGVLLVVSSSLSATDLESMLEARERIIERLPETENLWNRGLTGESNEGFVAARSSLRRDQITLIEEENRDRSILYEYISNKTGTQMLAVGRERSIMIARMAKNGLWVQALNGDWERK
ncbi:MAG: DUF1318 domain-containing protein [Verrucomicrobiota bacterium]